MTYEVIMLVFRFLPRNDDACRTLHLRNCSILGLRLVLTISSKP